MQSTLFKRILSTLRQIPEPPHTSPQFSFPMAIFPEPQTAPRLPSRHALPAVWMRAGTSKGLFIHRHHLPASKADWSPIILSFMGSKEGDQRQLNGIGGASSTTSKVAVVERSKRPGIDVDYTFIQVAPNQAKIDMSGNCGNIASGVGPFALDEGLFRPSPGQKEVTIRIFNTNTRRVIKETVQVDYDGRSREDGDFSMPGLQGTGSPIKVTFVKPAGSMTGKLFPTGNRQDWLDVCPANGTPLFTVRASLIDAANPFVLVDSASLPDLYHQLGPDAPESLDLIECIRREAAVRFGLADDTEAAALTRGTPKIAVLSPPQSSKENGLAGISPDITVTSFSMGRVHPSLQLTGAVCLAAGISILGTVPSDLSKGSGLIAPPEETLPRGIWTSLQQGPGEDMARKICIRHRGGEISAVVKLDFETGVVDVKGVTVYRTARRLFDGSVYFSV